MINAIERALVLTDGPVDAAHLGGYLAAPVDDVDAPLPGLRASERRLIEQALARADGNKTRAAEILNITRRRLYSRLKSLGLAADDEGA